MKYFKIFLVSMFLLIFNHNAYSKIDIDATYVILQDHLSGKYFMKKKRMLEFTQRQ